MSCMAIGWLAVGCSSDEPAAPAEAVVPIERVVDVDSFSAVRTLGLRVEIVVSPEQGVVLVGPVPQLDLVAVDVSDERLTVSTPDDEPLPDVTVQIAAPDIESLAVEGSGDIQADGLNSARLIMEISGAGAIAARQIASDTIDVRVGGSGEVALDGSCTSLSVEISGSGSVDAEPLRCAKVATSVSGSGNITASAAESATSTISGSGDVVIAGNPTQRDQTISGDGTVTYR
jgi:hypothetical protein